MADLFGDSESVTGDPPRAEPGGRLASDNAGRTMDSAANRLVLGRPGASDDTGRRMDSENRPNGAGQSSQDELSTQGKTLSKADSGVLTATGPTMYDNNINLKAPVEQMVEDKLFPECKFVEEGDDHNLGLNSLAYFCLSKLKTGKFADKESVLLYWKLAFKFVKRKLRQKRNYSSSSMADAFVGKMWCCDMAVFE